MTKKLLSALAVLSALVILFTSCKLTEPKGEPVTLINNGETINTKEISEFVNDQTYLADNANKQKSKNKFFELFSNSMAKAASYEGTDDININHTEYIDKTIIVSTTGTVELTTPVKSLVLENVGGAFTALAKADSIIINGSSITADIKYETGSIYVEGKDAVVNVYKKTENVFAHNVSVIINNLSDAPLTVTLTNGTQTLIESQKSYNVYENLVYNIR